MCSKFTGRRPAASQKPSRIWPPIATSRSSKAKASRKRKGRWAPGLLALGDIEGGRLAFLAAGRHPQRHVRRLDAQSILGVPEGKLPGVQIERDFARLAGGQCRALK